MGQCLEHPLVPLQCLVPAFSSLGHLLCSNVLESHEAKPWLSPVSSRGSPYSTKRDQVPSYTPKLLCASPALSSQIELESPPHVSVAANPRSIWGPCAQIHFKSLSRLGGWVGVSGRLLLLARFTVCCHVPCSGFVPLLTASWLSLSYAASADQSCHGRHTMKVTNDGKMQEAGQLLRVSYLSSWR